MQRKRTAEALPIHDQPRYNPDMCTILWSWHPEYQTLLQWLSLIGLIVFGVYLLTVTGLLQIALASDKTYISISILLLLALMSIFCGYRAWLLSRQHRALNLADIKTYRAPAGFQAKQLLALGFLKQKQSASADALLLVDVLSDRARDGHEVIWFVAGVMIKAGLVGTVIGFVQMLSSVSHLESFDTSQMQEVLQSMSNGMGVALYTTLVGMTSSVLLGLQVLLLDRSADRLLANTVLRANASQTS